MHSNITRVMQYISYKRCSKLWLLASRHFPDVCIHHFDSVCFIDCPKWWQKFFFDRITKHVHTIPMKTQDTLT